MRIIVTSDTHMFHTSSGMLTELPEGDMFIHCGDWSAYGGEYETDMFCEWLGTPMLQKFKHRIVVPGNHDIFCENETLRARDKFKSIDTHFLINEEVIIDGIKIWGSPYVLMYFNWAFMKFPSDMEDVWKQIPVDTNILITHQPPLYILDKDLVLQKHLGDAILKKYVDIIQPKYHFFGHIHQGYGKLDYYMNTTFVNASFCSRDNLPQNPPFIIDY